MNRFRRDGGNVKRSRGGGPPQIYIRAGARRRRWRRLALTLVVCTAVAAAAWVAIARAQDADRAGPHSRSHQPDSRATETAPTGGARRPGRAVWPAWPSRD